jgi:hypothetical protein
MNPQYILIDYENVQVKSLALLKGSNIQVRVFLGPSNTKLSTDLVLAMKELGDRADYIVLDAGGHNALDFHITYYLGRLAALHAGADFYVISKDKGFDSLIKYMNKNGVSCARAVSIADLPMVKTAAATTVAVAKSANAQAVPAGKVAAVKTAVKTAPAVKPVVAVKAKAGDEANTKAEPKPEQKPKPEAKPAVPKKKPATELVGVVLANLEKRKGSSPRTVKTLMSTIKTLCGEQYAEKEVDAVFNRLVKLKHVVVNGEKITYQLPEAK